MRRAPRPVRQAAAAGAVLAAAATAGCAGDGAPTIRGVVWQPDAATMQPKGSWDRLGARELLVQWTVIDGQSLVGPGENAALPDWRRIASEPWARGVIVGLANLYGEAQARADVAGLAERSLQAAAEAPPVRVSGWYFPVEIDPSWLGASELRRVLADLPRPLWVSAYDAQNIGPRELAQLLQTALPDDVGVMFQDGVGLHARAPQTAMVYVRRLRAVLGRRRVRLIAEAFRPDGAGGVRSATAAELAPQLRAYRGVPVYVFDGPHYLPDQVVAALRGRSSLSTP